MNQPEREPLISVVIPVYNNENTVYDSVSSILNQTYNKVEIIIIDDGSTDHSLAILREMQAHDSRIRLLINDTNQGLAATLNKGIRNCSGLYIARMDADDVALPERLIRQLEYLEKNPEVSIVGAWMRVFRERPGLSAKLTQQDSENDPGEIWRMPEHHEEIKAKLLFENCIFHPTILVKKEVFILNDPPYNEKLSRSQDYDLWMRLIHKFRFANLPEVLLNYRLIEKKAKKETQKRIARSLIKRHVKNNYRWVYAHLMRFHLSLTHTGKERYGAHRTPIKKYVYIIYVLCRFDLAYSFRSFIMKEVRSRYAR